LFDLGATICTPRSPACALCPWHDACAARAAGLQAALPQKAPKPVRPTRFGAHFWLESASGEVLLGRRPPHGLLGGMLELPGTAWRDEPWGRADALAQAPQAADWQLGGTARHAFTHFELRVDVYWSRVERIERAGEVRRRDALAGEALPAVMRRCIEIAQKSVSRFTLC
jgi:A/G-specific adenine glycosylase